MEIGENTKKVGAGAITGLLVGGIGAGILADDSKDVDSLNTNITNLNKVIEQNNLDLNSKTILNEELKSKLNEAGLKIIDLENELTEKDKELLEATKEIVTEVVTEDNSGYLIDDITLDGNFEKILKDDKVESLKDEKIEFDGEDYRVEEQIRISDSFSPLTSVETDDEFGRNIYVGSPDKDSVEYRYVFKEDINFSNVNEDTTLKIGFLGKSLELTEVGDDFIKIKDSSESVAKIGDNINGVSVIGIGENSVILESNGNTEIVAEGESVEFDDVTIQINNIFYDESKEDRLVVLESGEDITKTVSNGESLELFGEPEYENEALWVWSIDTTGDKAFIGAKLNQRLDDIEDDFKPLSVGEQLVLPNDYAALTFVGTNDVTYSSLNGEFDSVDVDGDDSEENVFVLKSEKANIIADDSEYDKLYVNGEDFYVYDDGEYKNVSSAYIEQDDDPQVSIESNSTNLVIDGVDFGLDYVFKKISGVEYFGDRSNHDNDLLTYNGNVIVDVEDNIDEGKLSIEIASEKVKVNLKID